MRQATLDTRDMADIVAAFNLVYEGYLIPAKVTSEWVAQHVFVNDIALEHSPLWLDDTGAVVGLAMLGVRGERGWVGAFGIAPEYRGRGLSHRLIEAVMDIARGLGLRQVQLEVLTGNAPAIRTYERAGFVHYRDLLILSRGPEAQMLEVDTSVVRQVEATLVLERRDRMRVAPPVWQREPGGLARMPDLQALIAGSVDPPDAFAVYRETGRGVRLLDAGATGTLLAQAVVAAVIERAELQPLTIVNEPQGSGLLPVLLDSGWREEMGQHEMVCRL